ncbi:MAG TPA: hypothetical protein VGM90_21205 [Kofleriaceae bacterium]
MLLASATAALAQPGPPAGRRMPPPPSSSDFDDKGWTLLGEQSVGGGVDHDKISVGRDDGKFNKLTVRVLDSDLEMIEFKITFADKTTYDPKVSQFFKEGQRTKQIDLPPSESVIKQLDFRYRNLPGGGRAKVQVYGFRTGDAGGPPKPAPFNWDSKGWTQLGTREVDGRTDHDRIEVGKYEGKFSKMTLVVRDSDLEMIDFGVKFARGPEWHPTVSHFFKENQRTHVIDFPGDDRAIKYIDFKYRNLPGGGRAKVEVWAWRTDNAAPTTNSATAATAAPIDLSGWTMLGEQKVNGRKADKDRIKVGRDEGKFSKLTIVVLDSDLQLIDFKVKFNRGQEFNPQLGDQFFREGERTHVIDLPGDKRVIKEIDFKYKNLPGGGDAKVQVWGR